MDDEQILARGGTQEDIEQYALENGANLTREDFEPKQYRKKPIVVQAIQYLREENIMSVQDFFGDGNGREFIYDQDKNEYYIKTLEGNMYCTKGDWIIKGVNGEFYPCKSDIFEKTYEEV